MALSAIALGAALASCGAPPLDGRWSAAIPGSNTTVTMTLAPDGTATFATAVASLRGTACTGWFAYTGVSWSSSGSEIRFSSGVQCSGAVFCGSDAIRCETSGQAPINGGGERDPYTLSADRRTLTVDFESGRLVFTAD